MGNINKYGSSKLVTKHALNQAFLIKEDATCLIEKEAKGTLSAADITKYRLLIGREPKLKNRKKEVK